MSTNHIRNIAIVGATGQVGKHITAALLAKKHFTLTALTRANSPATPPPGITTIPVDYTSIPALTSALRNQQALIITLSVRAPPTTQTNLIRAAALANVPFILPNEFGNGTASSAVETENGLGPGKRHVRELVEELGVSSWVALASGFWYQYSLSGPGLYGIDIAKREVVFFDDGTQRVDTSSWPQIGKAVTGLLSLPVSSSSSSEDSREGADSVTLSSYRNKFVHISSFTLNQREMLDSLNRVMGLTDADWKISRVGAKERWEDAKKMLAEGNGLWFAYQMYTRYFFPGENAALHELDNEKLGLPKEDLDEATREAVKMAEEGYFAKLNF